MTESRSIRIWYENLVAMRVSERVPLSALTPDEHIHGGLRIQFGDCLVPDLGFFGPDDVCFNDWLDELWLVARAFESATETRHVFDEGEQGQPAFVFERSDDRAYFSIADSEFSDGKGNPDWQRVEFPRRSSSLSMPAFESLFFRLSERRHLTPPRSGFARMIPNSRKA